MFTYISLGLALTPFVVGKVWDVQVGGATPTDFVFVPEALSAAVGDQVVFHFNPKNHSVTQSAFDNPCGKKEGGFTSGFHPVAANSSVDSRPTFTVQVNDTEPVWVFCGQAKDTPASHCGAGMVFSINCPSDDSPNSFGNFKKAALAIGASLSAAAASASETPAGGYGGYGGGYGGSDATPTLTAAYGDVTLPPAPSESVVTAAITLDSSSIWTTVYTSVADSPAPTPVAPEGAVHTVVVGGPGKILFEPNHIIANPRDTVVFQFQQKNHSVTQSSFADPCRRLNANNASAPLGLSSGFHPVDADVTDNFPTWSVTVNDTAPLWFYCGQLQPSSHCGQGMVFAINAVDSSPRNFTAYQNIAEKLNGTAAGALAAPSGAPNTTDNNTGGALSLRVGGGAGVVVTFIAMAASLL